MEGKYHVLQGSGGKELNAGKVTVLLEARGGIEPPNKGFADLCLTTWLPRQFKVLFERYHRCSALHVEFSSQAFFLPLHVCLGGCSTPMSLHEFSRRAFDALSKQSSYLLTE